MNIKDIGSIEFHDARIDWLRFSCEGGLEIEFRHICVYPRNILDDDMSNIWSAKAKLLLTGVNFVEIAGAIGIDDYITVGKFIDQKGHSSGMVDDASTRSARSCDFLLAGSGTTIKVSFDSAVWAEMVSLERIE